jgi:uncharacterized membrane protein
MNPGRRTEEEARVTREVAARAIRRLDILEWVILAGAAFLAIVGGWLLAVLVAEAAGVPFRLAWTVGAILLFGVPGGLSLRRVRREDRERQRIQSSERRDG